MSLSFWTTEKQFIIFDHFTVNTSTRSSKRRLVKHGTKGFFIVHSLSVLLYSTNIILFTLVNLSNLRHTHYNFYYWLLLKLQPSSCIYREQKTTPRRDRRWRGSLQPGAHTRRRGWTRPRTCAAGHPRACTPCHPWRSEPCHSGPQMSVRDWVWPVGDWDVVFKSISSRVCKVTMT